MRPPKEVGIRIGKPGEVQPCALCRQTFTTEGFVQLCVLKTGKPICSPCGLENAPVLARLVQLSQATEALIGGGEDEDERVTDFATKLLRYRYTLEAHVEEVREQEELERRSGNGHTDDVPDKLRGVDGGE